MSFPADAIVRELCAQAVPRPRQRLRRGDDERAPRRLCRLHGAATADGLLHIGGERHRVGGGGTAPASPPRPRHSSPRRSRGCRPAILVGSGSAWPPGALPLDFEVAGVQPGRCDRRFKAELPRLVAMLRGEESGSSSTATLPCWPAARLRSPYSSAAVSVAAAVRAARCGAGILMEGMSSAGQTRPPHRAFDEAGGTGSKVLIRRVWLGRVQSGLIDRTNGPSTRATPRAQARSARTRRSRPTSRTTWRSGWRRP